MYHFNLIMFAEKKQVFSLDGTDLCNFGEWIC